MIGSEEDQLFEWHLAYLRKNAQKHLSGNDSTPMTLVVRDRELLNKLLTKEMAEQSARIKFELPAAPADSIWRITHRWSKPLQVVLVLAMMISGGLGISPVLTIVIGIAVLAILAVEHFSHSPANMISDGLNSHLEKYSARIVASGSSPRLADLPFEDIIVALSKQITLMEQRERLIFEYCALLLCELDADGRIVKLNENAESIWGYRKGEIIGAELAEVIIEESFSDLLMQCRQSAQALDVELQVNKKDSEQADLSWHIEWSGKANSYFCMAEDISAKKRAERLRAEVSVMINHDLRAPISSLYYALQNMLAGVYGNISDGARDAVQVSARNLLFVLPLLDNLLSIEKLESNSVKIEQQKFEIQECFVQITDLLQDWCKAANVNFVIEPTSLSAFGDKDLTLRVLTNISVNAIKWAPAGSSVQLRASSRGHEVLIQVEDKGRGIPPELKDSLFQRWGAGRNESQGILASTGLGLFIARRLTELQGGSIGVKPAPEEGTIFWFTLPTPIVEA